MLYKAPELQAGAQHSHSVPKITAHVHYPAETQLLCSHVPGPHSRGRSHTLSQARKGGVTSSSRPWHRGCGTHCLPQSTGLSTSHSDLPHSLIYGPEPCVAVDPAGRT